MATYFKTAAGQPAFTAATRTGDYVITHALGPAEPTALRITAPFIQTRADYVRPAADDPLTYGALTAYFIDDTDFRDLGGGVCTWTRLWATVPAQWYEPEEYAFDYPAYLASTAGANSTVSSITASGADYVIGTALTGVSIGDYIYVSAKYTRGGRVYQSAFFSTAKAVSAGVSVTVAGLLPGTGSFSSVSGYIEERAPGRSEPDTLIVGSRVQHDYALSSPAALETDLPLLSKFRPITSAGLDTQYLTSGTATIPNSTDYATLIANAGELVADCSRRRYLGNIYVRSTRLVPAR